MKRLTTPISDDDLAGLDIGDQVSISGTIYTGRDAALPQLVDLIEKDEVPFDVNGAAIMHTAFSDAGSLRRYANFSSNQSPVRDGGCKASPDCGRNGSGPFHRVQYGTRANW